MNNNLGNKEIMAKNILKYMDLYEKDRKTVCHDLGISYTTFTDWVSCRICSEGNRESVIVRVFPSAFALLFALLCSKCCTDCPRS